MDSNDANGRSGPAVPLNAQVFKGSVYEEERELLRDVTVDLEEKGGGFAKYWGGTFQLESPRQQLVVGASYTLKLDDGRSGRIFIVDCDQSAASIDPWVSFRGSGALR